MLQNEFIARANLDAQILETWVAAGWLIADDQTAAPQFSELDLARAHLIHDLKSNVGVNDEGIGVILHLLDQLHGLRRTIGDVLSTLRAQPDDLRERLAHDLREAIGGRVPRGD